MSTALIDMTKFNKLASSLVYNSKYYPGTNIFEHEIYRFFGLDGFKNTIDDLSFAVTKFVSEIAMVNNNAYEAQYNEVFDSASLVHIDRYNILDNCCAILKSLRCIRYNCDLDESSKLNKKLNELIVIVTENIICQLPEYQNADWF